jgi:uridine kinase
VVLVDGRSGSGKSTLSRRLAASLGANLVRMDDLYPGWDGLEAGSEHVREFVLASTQPRWRRWDWASDEPAEWRGIDPALPLVVEGCGALSRANRALASYGIWVELDDQTRKRRALERDGDEYAPHWDRWAAQEEAFIRREHPRRQADVVVTG